MKKETIKFTKVVFSTEEVKQILAKEADISDKVDIMFEDRYGTHNIREISLTSK